MSAMTRCNRLIRDHFRRDGMAKRSFMSRADAEAFQKSAPVKKNVYRCTFGSEAHWHLGGKR